MTKPRAMVFSSFQPLPIDRGGKNRLFHLLLLLRDLAEVRLICLQRDWERPVINWSPLDGIQIRTLPVSKLEVVAQGVRDVLSLRPYIAFRFGIQRIIKQVYKEIDDFRPDIFWGSNISSFPFLKIARYSRRILDLVDSPSHYFQMAIRSAKTVGTKYRSQFDCSIQWRIQKYEKSALQLSDCVLVSTVRDKEYLNRIHREPEKVRVIENCVPAAVMKHQWRFDQNREPAILFIGNMSYLPNRLGVCFFAQKVFPRVRAQIPQAEFIICGNGSSAMAQQLKRVAGIRALGFVDDLISVYLGSSAVVVPVPFAGGTQYKLLEAMAIGIPIVASLQAAQIGDMKNRQELLVGDTEENYASMIVSVLQDGLLAKRLSDRGRKFISECHIWEDKKDLLREILAD